MMRACPRALDNPVRILGLSYAEWVVSAVAFSILVLMWRVVGLRDGAEVIRSDLGSFLEADLSR